MSIPLDETVYFDSITHNPTTGNAADADSTPTFAVYEEATDTDIGVGGNMTKRTSLTGNYRASFVASAANGFEVGKWYSVIVSATVSSVAGKAVALLFRVGPAENIAGYQLVDVGGINGNSTAAENLRLATLTMLPGTVDTATNSHTPTTTEFQADDITTAGNDNYIGRTIMFTSGTLNRNQQKITDYTVVGGIAQFTTDAFRVAPSNNDTFIIV